MLKRKQTEKLSCFFYFLLWNSWFFRKDCGNSKQQVWTIPHGDFITIVSSVPVLLRSPLSWFLFDQSWWWGCLNRLSAEGDDADWRGSLSSLKASSWTSLYLRGYVRHQAENPLCRKFGCGSSCFPEAGFSSCDLEMRWRLLVAMTSSITHVFCTIDWGNKNRTLPF